MNNKTVIEFGFFMQTLELEGVLLGLHNSSYHTQQRSTTDYSSRLLGYELTIILMIKNC